MVPWMWLSLAMAGPQSADPDYEINIVNPQYAPGEGPVVAVDEGHHNFHTVGGRYAPFADALRADGYTVKPHTRRFRAPTLEGTDIVVIANPLHKSNVDNWTKPTPSAFREAEIEALYAWVKAGGSLFLVLDHMPFPGAGGALAERFGFRFLNADVSSEAYDQRVLGAFHRGRGLKRAPGTEGPGGSVERVVTFRGSAFKAPWRARRCIVLGKGWYAFEPETANVIGDDTPSRHVRGWLQGATMHVGKGRIAVFAEAAMFSSQRTGNDDVSIGFNHPEAAQNLAYLRNLMAWLADA